MTKPYLSRKHLRQRRISWGRRVASFGIYRLREVDLNEFFAAFGYKKGLRLLFDWAEEARNSKGGPSLSKPVLLEFRYLDGNETRNRLKRKAEQERRKA